MKLRYLGAAVSQVGLLRLRRVNGQAEAQKGFGRFYGDTGSLYKAGRGSSIHTRFQRGSTGLYQRVFWGGVIRASCIDQPDFNAVLAAEMPHPKLTRAFKSHPMLKAVV